MSTRRKPPSRNPMRTATSTGLQIEARHRHRAHIPDPIPGQHMWTVIGMWRVTDPAGDQLNLDVENLMTLEGPGCFTCEQPFSPEFAAAPCPGEPS